VTVTTALAPFVIISNIATPSAATTTTPPSAVTATTDNQSVNVLINRQPTEIQLHESTEFTLDFQDPSSGESIRHVNYNFEIIDENGETVESMTDLHAHGGSDEQTVTFHTPGSFNLVVTILGTGMDTPFDTAQSGTAQTVVRVGQQVASPAGSNTATTETITTTDEATTTNATMGGGAAQSSACAPTQIGGGSQSTSMARQHIEEACVALQAGDTQGLLMHLNLALEALQGDGGAQGNMTTMATTAGAETSTGGGGTIGVGTAGDEPGTTTGGTAPY
ncbi:MAG: hypothetical protein M3M87_00975, partial [Thermoproteota archaeon]|nr:hypothetical protein [Thermoproteota archaeon]